MKELPLEEPVSLCDLLDIAAQRWPDQPAISFQGRTQNWEQTIKRIKGLAYALREQGVRAGGRVAYLGANSHWLYESYWSPALLGAILIPINYRLAVREMIDCVEDSTPTVLIVDDDFLEEARAMKAACSSITTLIYAGYAPCPEDMLSYERCLVTAQECELTPSSGDDVIMIFYTGGTTGKSKGVMLSNRNLYTNTVGAISLYRFKEKTSFLLAGPLFHLAAGARVFTTAALGSHTVILSKFDVAEVLRSIEHYRVNSLTLVPTMLQMILDHEDLEKRDLSSLTMLAYGAAPMPPDLIRKIVARFPDVDIFQTFGMTEAAPAVTTLDSSYHVFDGPKSGKINSVGKAVPYVKLKIVDEQGRELPSGETGEILIQGDNIMLGYWQLPELSAEALKGGWYHSGDAGYLDDEGFLYLEGRIKDMIVSGGENVYPIEVESVLAEHPAVHQCAVIGIPHEVWGEAVHGIVTLNMGVEVTEAELISFCKEQLAHYKCPVSITLRKEAMPLSAVNKILKSELRKPFWQDRKSQLI